MLQELQRGIKKASKSAELALRNVQRWQQIAGYDKKCLSSKIKELALIRIEPVRNACRPSAAKKSYKSSKNSVLAAGTAIARAC